ncbi:MAG: hypothetical protein E7404_05715 [Ruminococcaceae bacterium]|nr:hypothetical protein [Oscillospiraceae bacterium]
MAHELMTRYSELIDKKLQATLVTKDNFIFNNHYEGNAVGGKVKIPVRSTDVVVGDYNKASGMDLNEGSTTYIDLDLSYDKAVNEIIDGYDFAAVPDDIVAERLDNAGYALGVVEDAISIAALENEGTIDEDKEALTKENIYEKIVNLRTLLSEKNVPVQGRWLIVSPEVYGMLLCDTTNFIRQGDISQSLVESGAIGQIAGFTVYESSRLTKNDEEKVEGKTTTVEMIAGHPNWCHRVEEWSVPVAVNPLTNTFIGASAVQGRKIFGVKISNSDAVIVKRKEE